MKSLNPFAPALALGGNRNESKQQTEQQEAERREDEQQMRWEAERRAAAAAAAAADAAVHQVYAADATVERARFGRRGGAIEGAYGAGAPPEAAPMELAGHTSNSPLRAELEALRVRVGAQTGMG